MENSFAVITGLSSDTGMDLAKKFGLAGFELLIASNRDDIFESQRILEEEGFVVEAIKVNLATYAGVENLFHRIQNYGMILEALAINTEIGNGRPFLETPMRKEIHLVNQNIISSMHLIKSVLPDMKIRGKGKILISTSPNSDAPTKAFLRSFVESLGNELKDSEVTIKILMERKESHLSEGIMAKFHVYAEKAKAQLQRKLSEQGHVKH
jgi:short-subunit dehydrogenase